MEAAMQEIAPGVVHWEAFNPSIRSRVSSYFIPDGGVILDPMPPEEGFAALAERFGAPTAVILTNRHHFRHSADLQREFGATVYCNEHGMHQFSDEQRVRPFAFGDELPGGALAQEVGVLCPEETAVWFPQQRALAFADGVVRRGMDGPLGFVSDGLLGDDPEAIKSGLRAAFRRLAGLQPEVLLLAHGDPWTEHAMRALADFAAE
jgi:hypothetical protein